MRSIDVTEDDVSFEEPGERDRLVPLDPDEFATSIVGFRLGAEREALDGAGRR